MAAKAGEGSLRSVNVSDSRKQPFGEATLIRGWALWLIESGHSSDTLEPPSWGAKIPKLLWRGVPMVDVRQVSRGDWGDSRTPPIDRELVSRSAATLASQS